MDSIENFIGGDGQNSTPLKNGRSCPQPSKYKYTHRCKIKKLSRSLFRDDSTKKKLQLQKNV